MATLRRGRSIGEMSIINNFPRSSTVVARTEVRLAVFRREQFEDILKHQVTIGVNILKGLANLEHLLLYETQVTDEGVKRLRRALPKCKIQH